MRSAYRTLSISVVVLALIVVVLRYQARAMSRSIAERATAAAQRQAASPISPAGIPLGLATVGAAPAAADSAGVGTAAPVGELR